MALSISVPMPARLTSDLLCAALESSYGSGYWLNSYHYRSQYAGEDYSALHIGAPHRGADCDCDVIVKHSRIGASRIAAALSAMLTSPNHRHVECAGRVIGGNFDAPDADIVLQFAAFGEVIYG